MDHEDSVVRSGILIPILDQYPVHAMLPAYEWSFYGHGDMKPSLPGLRIETSEPVWIPDSSIASVSGPIESVFVRDNPGEPTCGRWRAKSDLLGRSELMAAAPICLHNERLLLARSQRGFVRFVCNAGLLPVADVLGYVDLEESEDHQVATRSEVALSHPSFLAI